ncbi:MAG: hypothetical protein M1816_002712 [Peltula sp. TS41687]|nr:MAG: hypothetical protein M1816_002712 [Peltula sp. TS41687]
MGKKRQPQFVHRNKPVSTTHPSLSRSTDSKAQPSATPTRPPTTVNERLEILRRTQAPLQDTTDVAPITKLSVVSLSKADPGSSGPRPNETRPNITPRRPPGPPAPPSWLTEETSKEPTTEIEEQEKLLTAYREMMERLDHLPGTMPRPRSLVHSTLKSLAKNWDWHLHYDQYHLATLPAPLKSQLLSYVSVYGSERGVNIDGLRNLFASESDVPGATSRDDVTRLDLSYSITRSISLKQLQRYLDGAGSAAATISSTEQDSWEACTNNIPASLCTKSFPNLTHLSLAYPGPNATWSGLLSLGTQLSTLTHLSLARWPVPTLTTPTEFRTTYKLDAKTPSAELQVVTGRAGSQCTTAKVSMQEAAGVLKRLSRATYCLKWLDLGDCHEWLKALMYSPGDEGAEWAGGWRGLETVLLRQAYSLSTLLDHDNEQMRMVARYRWALNFEEEARTAAVLNLKRKDAGLSYLSFGCSGDHAFEDDPRRMYDACHGPGTWRV